MRARVILAAVLAVFAGGQAWAADEADSDFGMVGVTLGQVARLNVVNAVGDPALRCTVELRFYDSQGGVLAGPDTKVLGAREAAFSDFALTSSLIRPGERVQIRATVTLRTDSRIERRECGSGLVPTLEVFSSGTGQTQFVQRAIIIHW